MFLIYAFHILAKAAKETVLGNTVLIFQETPLQAAGFLL